MTQSATQSLCIGHAQLLVDSQCQLGEGAGWDAGRQRLYWLDINSCCLHDCQPDGSGHVILPLPRQTSYAAPTDEGDYLLVAANQLSRLDPKSGKLSDFMAFEADNPVTRSNDARVDMHGSLWLSSMGLNAEPAAGSLYRLHHGRLSGLRNGLTIPNALCFSPDGRYAYFTDTPTGWIMRWALDDEGFPQRLSTGEFIDPVPWSEQSQHGGLPDGAVVDDEGCLWVALWGAGRVVRLSPDGDEIAHVRLPARHVSCPLLGGPERKTLYITTAREGLTDPEPFDGGLFQIDLSDYLKHNTGLAMPALKLSR
ncbi:SMP-30/gluconolactonase/LRE family protein [Halomonas sp. LS-001]